MLVSTVTEVGWEWLNGGVQGVKQDILEPWHITTTGAVTVCKGSVGGAETSYIFDRMEKLEDCGLSSIQAVLGL